MKKSIILLSLLIGAIVTSVAQVQVSLNVDPYPTPEISEWVDRNDLAIVTVTNSNPDLEGTQFRIKLRMLLDGNQVFETDNTTSILSLELGTETYLADEIVPYSAINFTDNSFKNKVLQTGLLPAGIYSFCISLIDLEGNTISTPQEICAQMIITDYQMPELLDPISEKVIEPQFLASTLFKWSPISPVPPMETGVKYIIAVTEIQEGQTPSQAFSVNYPIIEEEILIGTQFNWPLDIDAPDEDTKYVWSIKPVTNQDNPYLATNNGFVNIETFVIKGSDKEVRSGDEFACNCINDQEVDTSVIALSLMLIPDDDDEYTVLIDNGLLASLSGLIKYCISNEEGTKYSNPMHVDNFEVAALIDWDPMHIGDAANDHKYDPNAIIPHPIPEEIIVKFIIQNDAAGISCERIQVVEIPKEMQETINGEGCFCTEIAPFPELSLSQPEPEVYPRKLQIDNLITLRDFLWECNSNYNKTNHTMDVRINWDENHNAEDILNDGPFIHEYTVEDEIPENICVTYTISEKYDDQEELCTKEVCIPVSEDILALNIAALGDGTVALGESIFAGEHDEMGKGEFEVVTTELTANGDGSFTGKGTVYIDWTKAHMGVAFDSITIDTDRNLVSGTIVAEVHESAPTYPQDWAIGVVAASPWVNNIATNIVEWASITSGQDIPFDGLVPIVDPVKVPLGLNFPSGDQLAITEMVFRHDKSEFNLVAAKNTPPSWGTPVQLIGFIAKNIKFHPTQIELPPERMELLEDVSIGNINGKITFTFKAPDVSNSGCYIEWNETGFTEFGVELESSFTREWLLPVPDDGTSRSKATLSAVGSDWDDLLFTGTLQESEIVDSQNMTILADSISYDMSDVRNPGSITFPENYEGETTNLFRGFYMKELALQLPESWATNTGGQPTVSIQEMIVDDVGVTLYGEATNVISYPNGEISDLYASIDTLYVDIEASSFREGGMKGRIGLPISKVDSIKNPLKYHALLNHPADTAQANYFQLTITPSGPIYTSLLKGEMTLDPTSNITAKRFEGGKKTFDIDINGDFVWDDADLGVVNNVNFEMEFQGVGMNYDSSKTTDKLEFDIGTWAFASPQKKMANFPVTIDKIEYESLPTTGTELMRGKVKIPVIVNLSKKIGGSTTLSVEGKIEDKSASGGKKFHPEYVRTRVDSINIHANMAAVKIKGAIGFRNEHPIYGNGFIGTLDAEFKVGGIKVGALAEFGNTTYLNPSRYRYWRVEADATFPAPGITFLPGMAFRGFGGGAFNNMEATLSGTTYSFSPKKSSLGFRANAVLATTPKEETFNADVGLLGEFSGSGGLSFIGFNGEFYVGAGFAKRDKAKIIGDVSVSYDFPQKHFNMTANVNVNANPITTPSPANLVLDINGKTNKWYFKFGEPENLNTVNVFGISLYEYLMFGNDIPYPNGFTNNFTDAYYGLFGYNPNGSSIGSGGVGSNTATGKGFALGIGFMFDKTGDAIITKYNNNNKKHTLYYSLSAGAELNLSYMEYLGSCDGYNPLGINGWRAKGGLGFYGSASASVRKYKKNGSIRWNRNIAALKAGAWITGEFPNPYYVKGAIDGSVTVLDLFEFSVHKEFEKGTKCTNGSASSGAPVVQGDAAADQQNQLIQYVNPAQTYNFPITSPLIVKYGLIPNEVFDISEQQSNGTVEMRTFKMQVTKTLKVKNDDTGAWSTVFLNTNENNLGEHLYTKTSSGTATDVGGVIAPGISPSGGTNLEVAGPTLPMFTMGIASPPSGGGGVFTAPLGFSPAAPLVSGTASPSGFTSYPSPSGSDEYDDLPPDPEPVLNSLTINKNYRFTVTATLKEWDGSGWVTALKNNGAPVTQTVTKNFRTGEIEAATGTGASMGFGF